METEGLLPYSQLDPVHTPTSHFLRIRNEQLDGTNNNSPLLAFVKLL